MIKHSQDFILKFSFVSALLLSMFSLPLISIPSNAWSDVISERTDGVYFEDAVVSAATKGGIAIVQFKITNFGLQHINLQGIRASFAETGKLLSSSQSPSAKSVTGFLILEEETIDFSSSHLRGELHNISQNLVSGDSVEIELEFAGFTTTTLAHVH